MRRVGEPDFGPSRRVLVDRLWPRGVARERADWDEWLKEAAPSTEVRRAYGHVPELREEFVRRYLGELDDDRHQEAVARLLEIAREGPLTLVTRTRSVEISQVPVLRAFLLGRLG